MALSDPRRVAAQYGNPSNLDSRMSLHQRVNVNESPWHRWAFDHLNLPSNTRVLEIGCGNAVLWIENRRKTPKPWRITLTDLSPGKLEDSHKNISLNFRKTLTLNFGLISTGTQELLFEGEELDRRGSSLSETLERETSKSGGVSVAKGACLFVARL